MWPGMMPILHLPGVITPGQLGPTRRVAGFDCRNSMHLHHVGSRDAFGDADDQRQAGVGGFHDGVGGKGRRNEDHGGVRAGFLDGLRNRIEHRAVEMLCAAFARRDAADHVGAVGDRLLRVERAFFAGEALENQSCVLR